jgi:hypothetical protein
MTQHIEIQNPEEYTLLFTDDTDKEKLEEICMTLAHLPTAEAAALLAKFNEHIRAKEVEWLTCAIEENQYHHLTPCNEQEERDFLALKVIQEMEDHVIDLEVEYDKEDLGWQKNKIKLEAIKSLVAEDELSESASYYDNEMPCQKNRMIELRNEIETQEKIIQAIKRSIQTERYKKVNSMTMQHYHFD